MSNRNKLAQLMRDDWNRRVSHDYRFWMSDGYKSDEEMWQSGERDLPLLLEGLTDLGSKTAVEIGCGVGRLIKPAARRFEHVIGIDVSDEAIKRAHELLGPLPNVALYTGNGVDLSMLEDKSIDVVMSFAALTSVPTEIIASYLREIHRVLKDNGVVRLQMYIGKSQTISASNTLHIRCFDRERFPDAMKAAGFTLESIRPLVLPFQVSSPEWGIEAVVVELKKNPSAPLETVIIAQALLPEGEPLDEVESTPDGVKAVDIEYWMTLKYAKELLTWGDLDKAKATFEYALTKCQGATVEATELVKELSAQLSQVPSAQIVARTTPAPQLSDGAKFREANMAVLSQRFPELAKRLVGLGNYMPGIEVKNTAEGAVLYEDGQCLDHPEKPVGAGKAWATRTLAEPRFKTAAQIAVVGFGAGYHLEALVDTSTLGVIAIEPRLEVLQAALGARDLTKMLQKIESLGVGEDAVSLLSENSELVIRPQTQAVAGELCAKLRSAAYGTRGLNVLHPTIAVLGPLQGGTLPIMHYVGRSLSELKQRLRVWDVSGFAQGFHHVEDFLTDKMRRVGMQNHYTEMISQLLIESVVERSVDIVICMAQAPISGRALLELRKRGVITVLWFVEDFHRFSYWKEMSKFYDYVFTIQKGECIEAIQAAGAGHVHYLPSACDPEVHRPMTLTAEERARWGSPISFVGAGYHNRQQVFAGLSELPFKIWGTEWPTCRPFDKMVQEQGRRLTPAEYTKIFASTDINLNLHSSSERDGVDPFGDFVNPRTYELAAAGAFQLVDERQLLPESFVPGKEIVTFKTPAEMREKIQYYLAHPDERAAIAEAGRKRALKDHTYQQRIREMLSVIYSRSFEHLKRREEQSGWGKLLSRASIHEELSKRCKTAFERGEDPKLDGLVSDIVAGHGKLSETEQKLMFLFHIRKQVIRMNAEERGEVK